MFCGHKWPAYIECKTIGKLGSFVFFFLNILMNAVHLTLERKGEGEADDSLGGGGGGTRHSLIWFQASNWIICFTLQSAAAIYFVGNYDDSHKHLATNTSHTADAHM